MTKIKKKLKKVLTEELKKPEKSESSSSQEENVLKTDLNLSKDEDIEKVEFKVDELELKKSNEDFQLLTEVKNQEPTKTKLNSGSSRSGSINSIPDLSKLPDYKGKKSKKKQVIKKKQTESMSSLADISKNLTFTTNNKLIRYKFEDLTLTEFQKRLDAKDYIISEKLDQRYNPKQLLVELLSLCRIVPKPEEVQVFAKEVKKVKEKLNLLLFRKTCESWFNEIHFPKDLKSKLVVSIKEYETMKSKMMPNEDPTFIDSLITMLKSQLRKILELAGKESLLSSLDERCRSGCHEVFMYYCKNPQNQAASSLEVRKKFDSITLAKFIKFSEDFGILENHKNPEKNRIKSRNVEEIFEKNSNSKKDMHEYQFFQALENVSLIFFDENYDIVHKTQWKSLQDDQKVVKFFEVLGFHEPSVFNRKMKGNKFTDLNSLLKYSFDVSHSQNFTPKSRIKAQSTERTLSKIYSDSKLTQKPEKLYKDKPVTWDQLANTENQDYDLMNLINEASSEEDQEPSAALKKSGNTISEKILQRASELTKQVKKQESEKLRHLLKIAENRNEKQINITKKFRK